MGRVSSNSPARLLISGLNVVSRLSLGANCTQSLDTSKRTLEFSDVLMALAGARSFATDLNNLPLGTKLTSSLTAVANLVFCFLRGRNFVGLGPNEIKRTLTTLQRGDQRIE